MKLADVENRSAIVSLGRNAVVFPADSQVESQGWGNLPLILEIGHVESAPKLVAAPWGGKRNPVQRSVREARFKATRVVSERQVVVGGLALVEPNPANLHAGLEGMSAMRPNQVVHNSECGSNLDVGVVVIEGDEGVGAYGIGKNARLWVDKWRPIDIDLGLVEEIRPECVLQRQ